MHLAFGRATALSVLALALAPCGLSAAGPAPDEREAAASPTPELPAANQPTAAQRRQARRVLTAFRQSRQSADRRADAARELLSWGEPGAVLLLDAVEGELHPLLARYRNAFTAAATARVNRSSFDPAEVAALRDHIRQVSQMPNLTEKIIREQSEPALNRLYELLLVDRAELLASTPSLAKQRAEMANLGQYWQSCHVVLANIAAPDPAVTAPPTAMAFDEYLIGEEQLAVQSALPMSEQDRAALQANSRLVAAIDPAEARGILALNLLRMLVGMNPLAIDPDLCQCARGHSHDMRTHNFFSHESPLEGKASFVDRAERFNTKASAENIAVGPVEGLAVLKMWFVSPGHHKNLLGQAQRTGLGRDGPYWTQLFGR